MTRTLLASNTLAEHLLRGGIGAGAPWYGIHIADAHPWLALVFGVAMLIAFRGCPTCWAIGLFETIWRRLTRKSPDDPTAKQ